MLRRNRGREQSKGDELPVDALPAMHREENIDEATDPSHTLDHMVATAGEQIDASIRIWRNILNEAKKLRTVQSLATVDQRIQEEFGDVVNPGKAARSAEKLLDGLTKHALITARYISIDGSKIEVPEGEDPADMFIDVVDSLTEITNEEARKVLKKTNVPYILTVDGQIFLVGAMIEADKKREKAIELFVEYHGNNHAIFRDLDVSLKRADGQDERLLEIQKMIHYDWHAGNEESCLKQYLKWLRESPGIHIDEFADLALESGKSNLSHIKEYAQFALTYSEEEITNENMKNVIKKTYRENGWEDLTQFQNEFNKFVEAKIAEYESQVGILAGIPREADIRHPRSLDDVLRSRDGIEVDLNVRRRKRNDKKLSEQAPSLDLDSEEQNEIEKKILPLGTIRRIQNQESSDNAELVEATLDGIVGSLKLNFRDGNGLEEDVRKMLEYLQVNPINPGTKRLQSSSRHYLNIDGKRYDLMRFRPQHAPGLGTICYKDIRVVHAIVKNHLVIIDVLPHKEFDKKY